jgi:hypothetical protein
MLSVPTHSLTIPQSISDDTDWYYQLKRKAEIRAPIEERWFSFTRGLKEHPTGESHKFDYLVEHFVDEITGPYDQDVSLLLVGNKGKGKSLCGLALCYYSACELAERKGGKWQDFFDPVRNLAVILEQEATALMAIQDKYQVKDYDDIGIGWGARNWQDQDNKDKNDVFQINRTDSTIQVFSVPNQFLLDKVPRSLVSHYAEMDQQFFAHGFTTVKMFKPETLFREGKIIQPYLAMDRTKYVLFRVPKPPQDLVDFYQKKRKLNKTLATNTRLNQDDTTMGGEKIKKPRAKNAATLAMEERMMGFSSVIQGVKNAGGSTDDMIEALIQAGVGARSKVKNWVKSPSFKELFP